MPALSQLKNRLIAKVITSFPSLSKRFTDKYQPSETTGEVPWVPLKKELRDSKLALVSTCGVHHRGQEPFNMKDPDGDPSFRTIDNTLPVDNMVITHDYYDHTNADKDINIVFPIERLKEFESGGVIGELAATHFGFMGHIDGAHLGILTASSAPEVAGSLRNQGVDAVLLTPA